MPARAGGTIPLLDLSRQHRPLESQLHRAFRRVLSGEQFILGPEVARFEREFARFCGVKHAVGVASGTDALELALRAAGVGPGDRVATASFTFIATADAVRHAGAEPLFVDIDPARFTLDPAHLESLLLRMPAASRRRVKAVIPVHLYGHPCDMDELDRVAQRFGLSVIEDAAQALGAAWRRRAVGTFGLAGCFSFFPSKTLGGFGDGGMVTTSSGAMARKLRALRVHGRDSTGRQVWSGRNSRLDELQAALLRVKLRSLRGGLAQRRRLAARYTRRLAALKGKVVCPSEVGPARHAWCLYVIRCPQRAKVQARLKRAGIRSQVYYSTPVHRQPLYGRRFSTSRLPHTEKAAREALALPLFPGMTAGEVDRVCRKIRAALS